MPFKPTTSPVIRATLTAMDAVNALRDARLAAAQDDMEQERVQTEHRGLLFVLATILHEAQFGPPIPVPHGPRLVPRDPGSAAPPRAIDRTALTRPTDTNLVYQLKITLRDSTPPTWRRVQVRGNTSLSRLHAILQVVMGWTDSHLHEFVIRDVRYGMADMEWDPMERPKDERRVRLGQLDTREQDRFRYAYDFGDGWDHDILVEKIMPPEPGLPYPRCIAGKRACPPEDVGGLSGYSDFLTTIRNPRHEEHDDLLMWAGGAFNSEAFDIQGINQQLERLAH